MAVNEKEISRYIELRLSASGGPWVAVLGSRCRIYGFQRLFNQFRVGCERLPDGGKVEIHHLPCEDLTYEVEETIGGKRTRWYAATMKGVPTLHRISRYGALMVACRAISIREAVEEYPEMPPIEIEEE